MTDVVDLWKEPEQVLVKAGINKATNRQLWISTYDDCDDWSISVVPSIMSLEKAHRLVELATKTLNDKKNKVPQFEIVGVEGYPEIARILGHKGDTNGKS